VYASVACSKPRLVAKATSKNLDLGNDGTAIRPRDISGRPSGRPSFEKALRGVSMDGRASLLTIGLTMMLT
jgi:hypothetical protein